MGYTIKLSILVYLFSISIVSVFDGIANFILTEINHSPTAWWEPIRKTLRLYNSSSDQLYLLDSFFQHLDLVLIFWIAGITSWSLRDNGKKAFLISLPFLYVDQLIQILPNLNNLPGILPILSGLLITFVFFISNNNGVISDSTKLKLLAKYVACILGVFTVYFAFAGSVKYCGTNFGTPLCLAVISSLGLLFFIGCAYSVVNTIWEKVIDNRSFICACSQFAIAKFTSRLFLSVFGT